MTGKQLSPEIEARIAELRPRFPPEHANKAMCIPVLWMAQKQFGYVDDEVCNVVAAALDLPAAHVLGVATFYTMFNKKPVGRYHLQLCTGIGRQILGAYDVFAQCKRKLGIGNHGTTDDDNITLSEVECIAACGYGPAAQIAERQKPDIPLYFEDLDAEKMDKILEALEQGRVPTELGR